MNYWLFKSEPETFSIDDLKNSPGKISSWEGVRNYQARNFLRDEIRKGDQVLFYHSNAKPPGVVGLAEVVKEGYPDHFAFDSKSKYFDPKSKLESPTWFMVDIKFKKQFKKQVSLTEIKASKDLAKMKLIQKGTRLSIQPLTKEEFQYLLKMAGE